MSAISRSGSVATTNSSKYTHEERNSSELSQSATVTSYASLARAVDARRSEFTRSQPVRIKIGTWNVAAHKGPEKDVGRWFVEGNGLAEAITNLKISERHDQQSFLRSTDAEVANQQEPKKTQGNCSHSNDSQSRQDDEQLISEGEEVGLYVLGLQEIVDITSATEALRPYNDSTVANRYKQAFADSLSPSYKLIAEQQLVGLLILIYASPKIAPQVRSVSTTSVGTGLMGYMGNKGAVTVRVVLGETTKLVFINSHMSAGTGKTDLERRNWDASQILSRTRFAPFTDSNGVAVAGTDKIEHADFAFWFGDLNYRLEGVPADDVRRVLLHHPRNEYSIGQETERQIEEHLDSINKGTTKDLELDSVEPRQDDQSNDSHPVINSVHSSWKRKSFEAAIEESNDPASLQTTINSLIYHDELLRQQKEGKMFHDGWREGPITFLPTYKYDVGSLGMFDSSEKKRSPSWCDRILFRSKEDRMAYERNMERQAVSKARDETMTAQGMDSAADEEEMLYEYDPETDGDGEGNCENTSRDYQDPMKVNSSNDPHDPIAITLEYYDSHPRICSSDHKPLEASFTLNYDAVVSVLKAKVQEEVASELDRLENECHPSLTLVIEENTDNSNLVDFGNIRFEKPKSRIVTIANTGRVTAYFGLMDRSSTKDTFSHPSSTRWLSTEINLDAEKIDKDKGNSNAKDFGAEHTFDVFETFKIEPGDTCHLILTVEVLDTELVRSLNNGDTLEEVIVVRVKNGPEHFLPVRGTWLASSHGSTIEKLIRIPEGGIRKLQGQHPKGGEAGQDRALEGSPVMWSAPREIFRLTASIESLVERIVAEYGILGPDLTGDGKTPWDAYTGWPFDERCWTLTADARRSLRGDVYEALDTDSNIDNALPSTLSQLHRLEVMAESLLSFLNNMQNGVITETLWTKVEQDFFSAKKKDKLAQEDQRSAVLEILSEAPNHNVTFVLLTSMLTRIAQEVTGTYAVPTSLNEMTLLPRFSIRRKTLELDPRLVRRQLVNTSFATIFAYALIKEKSAPKSKGRDARQAHKVELVQMFLSPETA